MEQYSQSTLEPVPASVKKKKKDNFLFCYKFTFLIIQGINSFHRHIEELGLGAELEA